MPRLSRRDHALTHLTRDAVFRRRLLEQRRLCGITGHRKETARVETAARRPRARLPRPGYWGDPGDTPYTYNFKQLKPSEYDGGPVSILQLPKEYVAINKAMGKWSDDPISASMTDQSGGCSFLRNDGTVAQTSSATFATEAEARAAGGPVHRRRSLVAKLTPSRD